MAKHQQDAPRRILSSITLVGPVTASDELMPTLRLTAPVLQWELNGVFTLPEARRRGIAAAVLDAAKASAQNDAQSRNASCLLTVVVYTDNHAAKNWYEMMGFTVYRCGEEQARPTSELFLHLPGCT